MKKIYFIITILLIFQLNLYAEKTYYLFDSFNFEEENPYYIQSFDLDESCGDDHWGLTEYRAADGSIKSIWCAQEGTQCHSNVNNSDIKRYDLGMSSYLIIGPENGFDFTHISDGYVRFKMWAKFDQDDFIDGDKDAFCFGVRYEKTPGVYDTYCKFYNEPAEGQWVEVTFPLNNVDGNNNSVIGKKNVWLCFIFYSGLADGTIDEGVYIDNIKIYVYPRIACYLYINKTLFKSGDLFKLIFNFINPTLYNSEPFDYYIVLDVYGEYFFGYKPQGTNQYQWVEGDLIGTTSYFNYKKSRWRSIIFDFIFPEVDFAAYELYFYGAVTDMGNPYELYDYDVVEFGFEPKATKTPTPSPTPIIYTPTPLPSGVPTFTPTPWIKTFRIYGNQEMLDTEIDLNQGERIIFNAEGTICFHKGDCDGTSVGPDGYSEFCYDDECYNQPYEPGRFHGALLGRIESAEYFLIGSHKEMNAPHSGRLRLIINDGNVSDNDGFFDVEIILPDR